jgi:hypothetical protein
LVVAFGVAESPEGGSLQNQCAAEGDYKLAPAG